MAPGPSNTISRLPDYVGMNSTNNGERERARKPSFTQPFAQSTNAWADIWNRPTTLNSGFGSTAREQSRHRENGTYTNSTAGGFQGRTGSSSLVATSESEWGDPTPWQKSNATSIAPGRSSAASPVRRRSLAPGPSSQPFDNATSSAYPSVQRNNIIGQGPVGRTGQSLFDPTSAAFASSRSIELSATTFPGLGGIAQLDTMPRSDFNAASWNDAGSVHSPLDDRNSIAASDYLSTASGAPSRSGSLPPSRHGGDNVLIIPPSESFHRGIRSSRTDHPSIPQASGRAYQERSGSIQSDSHHLYTRMSGVDHDQEPLLAHRSSLSMNGFPPPFVPTNRESPQLRDAYPAPSQLTLRPDDMTYGHSGTYTPETFTDMQLTEAAFNLQAFQINSRSAPNGSAIRGSPYASSIPTPPLNDRLYPSQWDQSLSHRNSIALVDNKLRGIQQMNDRRLLGHGQLHPQIPQMMTPNQLRNPYYQYSGMQANGLNTNLTLSGIPGMGPMYESPSGPRDQPNTSIRSRLLSDYKATSKSRKWELKDIYNHIVEFSGDQHGSRLIQSKLETANSEEKDRVFQELLGDATQLMMDIFGNYVIQKFFDHGDQNQKKILANKMKGQMHSLSKGMYSCRVVQKALEHILTDQQAELIKELEENVIDCVMDQNGNHVIQKAIAHIKQEHIQFIIDAFRGKVGALAVHQYGCRVIQRVLEHCDPSARRLILQELHKEGPKLIEDSYANYVVQNVIKFGGDEDRAKVIELVKADVLKFSKHKHASNVVERCICSGTPQQRREIMWTIANERPYPNGESALVSLIKDSFGNYVIQKLLDRLEDEDHREFVVILRPELERAKITIGANAKQLQPLETKMHRAYTTDNQTNLPNTPSAPSVDPPAGTVNSSDTPRPAQRTSISSATGTSTSSRTDSSVSLTPPLTSDGQSPRSNSFDNPEFKSGDKLVYNASVADKNLSPTIPRVTTTDDV